MFLIPLMAWFKSCSWTTLLVAGLAAAALGAGYTAVRGLEKQAVDKQIASEQAAQITQLAKDIKILQQSTQVTTQSILELNTAIQNIDQQAKSRNETVAKKVAAISASTLPPADKSNKVSQLYMDSLWSTYCAMRAQGCLPTPSKALP